MTSSNIELELYGHLWCLYRLAERKPIHYSRLISFLSARLPSSDQIVKALESAEKSDLIKRLGGTDTYIPLP